ncbi:archaemetzincin family Zn-dependent metalloprotease [Thermodesulfovibrio yellowstonii]|uniref:archaemetzincin family Zn-dependent metalloprotease n=1 Tax=Thermodesulfovibrio yellowstonii TaxID=28262 RepID=UPI003C7E257D
MKKFKIFLFLLCEINNKYLAELKNHLQNLFGLDVELTSHSVDLSFAYNERRRQYSGEEILRKAEKNKRNPDEKWLLIVDVDLYSSGLNFIFGLANPYSGTSIISLTRLRQQFYGKPENEKLFIERLKKEATHELGHLFYLGHCLDKKCVMHFSNSLYDTDVKSAYFCERCKKLLFNIKKGE